MLTAGSTNPYNTSQPIHFHISNRQLYSKHNNNTHSSRILTDHTCRLLPGSLKENEIILPHIDKIFTSKFISDHEILMSTKDNKMLAYNIFSGKTAEIPLLNKKVNHPYPKDKATGIYSFSINSSSSLIAIPSGNDIIIYFFPSFVPVEILKGHHDTVFKVTFTHENILLSASRDFTVRLWNLETHSHQESNPFIPIDQIKQKDLLKKESICSWKHPDKVRDSALSPIHSKNKEFASLSSDGLLKIWDMKTGFSINSVLVPHCDLVCVESCGQNVYVVGSQTHISFIDKRMSSIIHSAASLDEGWGVRCFHFNRDLLTIGGGLGRISFFDIRNHGYLDWKTQESNPTHFHESGKGTIFSLPNSPFFPATTHQSIYTLCYDQSGTRLFSAGGPIQSNISGSYASLW